MRSRVESKHGGMDRSRLTPATPPAPCGPTSEFSHFASISWQATSRPCKKPVSHLRLNTTAHCSSAHCHAGPQRGGKLRQRRDNVGWGASRSPAGGGPQHAARVPLQYMYCGLTNIMCSCLSMWKVHTGQATGAHGLWRCVRTSSRSSGQCSTYGAETALREVQVQASLRDDFSNSLGPSNRLGSARLIFGKNTTSRRPTYNEV